MQGITESYPTAPLRSIGRPSRPRASAAVGGRRCSPRRPSALDAAQAFYRNETWSSLKTLKELDLNLQASDAERNH